MTNYTTSGLLCPKYNHNSLLSSTLSLIVGIPLNGLFWGEIATRFFADVQVGRWDPSSRAPDRLLSALCVSVRARLFLFFS